MSKTKKSGAAPADAVTLAETADILKLHPNTVRKLASQGEIPGIKLGDSWRFSRSVLKEMLRGAATVAK